MSLAQSTENRKANASGVDWSYWQHFEPLWTLGPQERQWLRGTGDAAVARGFGFILAAVAGVTVAALGLDSILLKQDATGYLRLAVGFAFLVLGGFVCQGKQWASLSLMALFAADQVVGNLMAYRHGSPYYADHLGFWLVEGLLACACWMRVFYVALRAEQRRAAIGPLRSLQTDAATSPE
jgi:ABC-type amino acid transport system permease subunit